MKDQLDQKDLAKLPQCACFNLRKATRMVTQKYDRVLKPSGVRVTQFTILANIAHHESITVTQLAKALVMDRTTLTRNLRPLEKQKLIAIAPGEDLRMREVRLTAKGRQTLAQAFPLWEKAQTWFVEGMGQPRWQNLLASLSTSVRSAQRT
jgi:DNA-binding MarR family transcriptional regulator